MNCPLCGASFTVSQDHKHYCQVCNSIWDDQNPNPRSVGTKEVTKKVDVSGVKPFVENQLQKAGYTVVPGLTISGGMQWSTYIPTEQGALYPKIKGTILIEFEGCATEEREP